MDDPGWTWPAWKFGMKRNDLFTSLHDQYNTFTYTIQDAEAFHHDVYEISSDAETPAEFHRLMAARRIQRLRELTESLESLAVEIIANPKLMATDQWQHALQLFRNKSFDSIVRFFASYIPDDYPDHHSYRTTSSSNSSFCETTSVCTTSTKASSVDSATSPTSTADDFHNITLMTEEPLELCPDTTKDTQAYDTVDAPLSPPDSVAAHSDVSSEDALSCGYSSTNPPSRSMSFSGSESGAFSPELIRRSLTHDDETFHADSCDTAASSIVDGNESQREFDVVSKVTSGEVEDEDEDDFSTAQFPEDSFDALDLFNDTPDLDIPTPTKEAITTHVVGQTPLATRRFTSPHRRSPSPKPHSSQPHPHHRREGSPLQSIRRSPEESLSKIQKVGPDAGKRRPKGRRRVD